MSAKSPNKLSNVDIYIFFFHVEFELLKYPPNKDCLTLVGVYKMNISLFA